MTDDLAPPPGFSLQPPPGFALAAPPGFTLQSPSQPEAAPSGSRFDRSRPVPDFTEDEINAIQAERLKKFGPDKPDDAAPTKAEPETPSAPARNAGLGEVITTAATQPFRDIAQTYQGITGGKPAAKTPGITAAEPITLADVKDPALLGKKFVYGLLSSSPEMAGAIMGGAMGAGPAAVTGPGAPVVEALSVGAGAALGHAVRAFGPAFGEELKKSPGDPDGAFNRAWVNTGISSAFTGGGFAAFGIAPFASTLKNLMFQGIGIQAPLAAGEQAVSNIREGKPALEGAADAAFAGAAGTMAPMAVHAGLGGLRDTRVDPTLRAGMEAMPGAVDQANQRTVAPNAPAGTAPVPGEAEIAKFTGTPEVPSPVSPEVSPDTTPAPPPPADSAHADMMATDQQRQAQRGKDQAVLDTLYPEHPEEAPVPPPSDPLPEPPVSGSYVMLSPDQLTVDPARFQFKASDEKGVTGALQGTDRWEPDLASSIMVWQDRAGQMFVADGHQRHDLATRAVAAGQEGVQIPARLYREADGYDPAYMRSLAAYKNISEGSGTAIDAAKVMRDAATIPDDRRLPDLPPRQQMVRDGAALAKLSDDAFGVVVNGVVPPGYAAHVGNLISDPAEQMGALQVLARAQPANSEQARLMVQDVRNSGFAKGIQDGLFGEEAFATSLIPERARVLDNAMRNLRGTRRVFKAAVEGEETLTGAGNTLDTEGNLRAKTENERLLDSLERNATTHGPVSDALNAAARDLSDGRPMAGVVSQFLAKTRGIVRGGQDESIRPGDIAGRDGGEGQGEAEQHVEGQEGFFARREEDRPEIKGDLTPAALAARDRLSRIAAATMRFAGLPESVGLKLVEKITDAAGGAADGHYARNLVTLALDTAPHEIPAKLWHETVHALVDKDLGLLTATQRRALEVGADRWLERAGNRERLAKLGYAPGEMREEAIARMGEESLARGLAKRNPFMRAYDRITNAVEGLRQALRGGGYHTAEDVFRGVMSGERATPEAREALGRAVAGEGVQAPAQPEPPAGFQTVKVGDTEATLPDQYFARRAPLPPQTGTDLFGEQRVEREKREPEPTIRNDKRQTDMFGGQEAVQAQASRDAAGPRGGQKAADEGLFAAKEAEQKEMFSRREQEENIRAYHGSPHDFDAFDASKIGTGEGAQAYGHGLYFAGEEGVAKGYRDALSREQGLANVWKDRNGNLVDMHALANGPSTDPVAAAANWMKQRGGPDSGITPALDEARAMKPGDFVGGAAERQATIDGLMSFERRGVGQRPGGSMYEVNIAANPDHFLDWDKPLSEQHPVVQQKIANLSARSIGPRDPDPQMTGGEWYQDAMHKAGTSQNVAGLLASPLPGTTTGIPGIRYLDGGSRASGEGTSNHVVFDPATIEILRKYSRRDPVEVLRDAAPRSLVARQAVKAIDYAGHISEAIKGALTPMATGSKRAQDYAFRFANALRGVTYQFGLIDNGITRQFKPEAREAMGRAMDNESVFEQRLAELPPEERAAQEAALRAAHDATGEGIAGLPADQRAVVEQLAALGQTVWQRMRDRGLVAPGAEGLPYYFARQIVMRDENGEITRVGGDGAGGNDINEIAKNVSTRGPQRREHLTPEETEAAAKAKLGTGATLIRDIRSVVQKLATNERAIAGTDLLAAVKKVGDSAGVNLVLHGDIPNMMAPGDYFTLNHPSFRKWTGTGWQNIHVAREFEGPMRAVLSEKTGDLYNALMKAKGGVMSAIMYSPFMHLGVEIGRALPLMPGKIMTMKFWRDAYTLRNDSGFMAQATKDGLAPIGQGWSLDPVKVAEEARTDNPKSTLGQMAEKWHEVHQRLLWDQVFNLQVGIYNEMRGRFEAKGFAPDVSGVMAAHMANRYAGALPPENLSRLANQTANLVLFSRSFTLGNLGVIKDMFNGAPAHIRASIEQMAGQEVANNARSALKRKAVATFALDIGLFYVANAALQSLIATGQRAPAMGLGGATSSVAQEWWDNASDSMSKVGENPMNAFGVLPQHFNEPGKQDRVYLGNDSEGRGTYLRLPAGKVGEEFLGWFTHPGPLLMNKLSPFVRPLVEAIFGTDSLGRPVYKPDPKTVGDYISNAGMIATHLVSSAGPVQQVQGAYNAITGRKGDAGVEAAKAVLPTIGLGQISGGYQGGPQAGFEASERRGERYDVTAALPDVRALVKANKIQAAVDLLEKTGARGSEIRGIIRHAANPAAATASLDKWYALHKDAMNQPNVTGGARSTP